MSNLAELLHRATALAEPRPVPGVDNAYSQDEGRVLLRDLVTYLASIEHTKEVRSPAAPGGDVASLCERIKQLEVDRNKALDTVHKLRIACDTERNRANEFLAQLQVAHQLAKTERSSAFEEAACVLDRAAMLRLKVMQDAEPGFDPEEEEDEEYDTLVVIAAEIRGLANHADVPVSE